MNHDWIAVYTRHLQGGGRLSPRTIERYRFVVRHFLRWLSQKGLALPQLTRDRLEDYLRVFRDAYGYGNTVSGLATIRGFIRCALQEGWTTHDPTKDISCRWLDVPGGWSSCQGVLRKILERPAELFKYRLPLFAPHTEAYLQSLLDQGYTKATAYQILPTLRLFQRYLQEKRIRSLAHVTPSHIEGFVRSHNAGARKKRSRPLRPSRLRLLRNGLTVFMTFAFRRMDKSFLRMTPRPDRPVLPQALLHQFLDFCRQHKGSSESTLVNHFKRLLHLADFLHDRGLHRIEDVDVATLDALFVSVAKSNAARSLPGFLAPTRAFFRFLYVDGRLPYDLSPRLDSPCRFSKDLRPKYLPWPQVQKALASVDRRGLMGARNYAFMTLLVFHGLRPGEVAHLHLTDIDWKNRSFLLRARKNGTAARLPLAPQAARALRRYLALRPSTDIPFLFLSGRAPLRPITVGAITAFVVRLVQSCFGRSLPLYGAYLFRHSFAKVLLDRGASVSDVGTFLGHRSLESTTAYSRIHTRELRDAADNFSQLLGPVVDLKTGLPPP